MIGRDLLSRLLESVALAMLCATGVLTGCQVEAVACEAGLVRVGLTNGATDAPYLALTDAQANAVVQISFHDAHGDAVQLCTGTLITRALVVSAAHCLREQDGHVIRVSLGAEGEAPLWFTEATAIPHPTLDVMLLELRDTVAVNVELTPVTVADTRQATLLSGALVQVAGYGDDAAGKSGDRQFLVEQVLDVQPAEITVSADSLGGACFGDSGGPLLTRGSDGSVAVVGVLSRGAVSCFGDDVYTRVDGIEDWLQEAGWQGAGDDAVRASTLGIAGRCFGATAVWEEGGASHAGDCRSTACGWSASAPGYRCIDPNTDLCDGITDIGQCNGDHALGCNQGRVTHINCTQCDARCARSPRTGRPICVTDR